MSLAFKNEVSHAKANCLIVSNAFDKIIPPNPNNYFESMSCLI